MLKLIIADDERVIRESISNAINWADYGIQLIAICRDGIEAYDIMMDELPALVLTDIRMPGLSGLELVERAAASRLPTQFIILSGFGEFEYAKTAMQYGVKHYLLKPCTEVQLKESLLTATEDYYRCIAYNQNAVRQGPTEELAFLVLQNMITEGLSKADAYAVDYNNYQQYLNTDSVPYRLYVLFMGGEPAHKQCAEQIEEYRKVNAPSIPFYILYVKDQLFLFFEDFHVGYTNLEMMLTCFSTAHAMIQMSFYSLQETIPFLINQIISYSTVSFIRNKKSFPICNYKNLTLALDDIAKKISCCDELTANRLCDEVITLLQGCSNIDFLKQLVTGLILHLQASTKQSTAFWADFLLSLNQATREEEIFSMTKKQMLTLLVHVKSNTFVENISNYIDINLSDRDLTLKKIAEEYLYMNVDYVSRKFSKESGKNFSQYIAEARIARAKTLLQSGRIKGQMVAKQVGFGDNYQYFSQIFKKHVGMTPMAYAKAYNS